MRAVGTLYILADGRPVRVSKLQTPPAGAVKAKRRPRTPRAPGYYLVEVARFAAEPGPEGQLVIEKWALAQAFQQRRNAKRLLKQLHAAGNVARLRHSSQEGK